MPNFKQTANEEPIGGQKKTSEEMGTTIFNQRTTEERNRG